MSRVARLIFSAAIAAVLVTANASAQLLGGLPLPPVSLPAPVRNLPVAGPLVRDVLAQPQARQVIRPTLNSVAGLPESIARLPADTLLDLRRERLEALIRDNRRVLEEGEHGQPVRRGVLLALDPDPVSLRLAQRAGFRVIADQPEPQLGMRMVKLAVPADMKATSALKVLKKVAPRLDADFDHVFEPAGGALRPLDAALASSAAAAGRGGAIGMIDGGVASHPSFKGASVEQRGFAGSAQPTGHGTAVASLLVGSEGRFQGAARGARLYVADVYGGNRAAGSASTIVKALAWLVGHRPKIINISLVGPANDVVQRAIRAVQARGITVVAAVGNDGPAAPPQYPASYPGVLAITAVDDHGRALPEAGRAKHLDFAAPGADMAAALPGGGYAEVRGTSFASPLAAARLYATGSVEQLAAEAKRGKGRVGRGIVCGDCRVDPRSVGAK